MTLKIKKNLFRFLDGMLPGRYLIMIDDFRLIENNSIYYLVVFSREITKNAHTVCIFNIHIITWNWNSQMKQNEIQSNTIVK